MVYGNMQFGAKGKKGSSSSWVVPMFQIHTMFQGPGSELSMHYLI